MVYLKNKQKEEQKKVGFIPIRELLNEDGSFKNLEEESDDDFDSEEF